MLVEKFGLCKMIIIVLVWWSVFIILMGMIKNYGLIYLVRFLFGVGEVLMYFFNVVFNLFWFFKNEKGRVLSVLLVGLYFGFVLVLIVIIVIVNVFNW